MVVLEVGIFRAVKLLLLFVSGAHAYDLLDYRANIQACINHDLEACYRISREQVPVTTYNLGHTRNKDAYDRDQTFNEALVMTQRFTAAMQQCRKGNIDACEALLGLRPHTSGKRRSNQHHRQPQQALTAHCVRLGGAADAFWIVSSGICTCSASRILVG